MYLVSPRMDDNNEADLELRLFDSLLSVLGLSFPALFLEAIKLSLLFVALMLLLLPPPPTAVTLALLAAFARAKATKSEDSP